MEDFKKYLKISFWIITIYVLFLTACVNIGIFQGINFLRDRFHTGSTHDVLINNISTFMANLELISRHFYVWVLPAVLGMSLLLGWILWAILRTFISKIFIKGQGDLQKAKSQNRVKKDFVDQKIEQERKRRLFLQGLSILQRDGRLLDFFDEDLSLYEDEQIGAAVRSVQEDCKKTIKKYFNLKPVIEKEEGEMIRIEPGFDIDSIKLIGNVAGEPPFEGILKHRGWKAGKKEIPKLSDIRDAAIITPAEVEIQ